MVVLKLNNDQKPRIIKQPELGQLPGVLRLQTDLPKKNLQPAWASTTVNPKLKMDVQDLTHGN